MTGLGVVLFSQMQDNVAVHLVAYALRSLDKHERNYGMSELETLGLVWAVPYFRTYLIGHPCVGVYGSFRLSVNFKHYETVREISQVGSDNTTNGYHNQAQT